jgi:serine/threonine protein kinase
MEKRLHINQIENRQYVLSPAIQSGNDRECINKDFYQEGDNSSVYIGKLGLGMKVVHRKTNIPYTIIHFEKEKVSKLRLQKKINSTLDLMYKSSHPYLFRLLNHYETQTHVFMIFESYDGDSLDQKIINGKCDLQNSLKYLVEVMLGVQHMHSFNLYNLNVNPENVLISECVKLTDYGLKMEGKNEKPKRNTIYKKKENINYIINAYTSPEELNAILNGKPCILNGKTDSWNCGILLYEMLTSFKSPFKGETDEEIIDSILNCNIDLSPIKDDFCRNLISKLVKKNPKDRISIDEVLNMDYIKNVDIEQPEIDFSDNIINPIDEQEFSRNMSTMSNSKNNTSNSQNKQNNVNTKNQQYNKAMETLKSENDSLKKMIEDLKKQVVSSKIKKKTSKHTSKLKSMVIDVGGEIIADENEGQNLGDLLNDDENNPNEKEKNDNKDNKIDEIKKNIKNEIIEEEEDDDEEFSEKEEEYNDENLFVRCEKYKDRNIQLKDKLLKISRKNKRMKNTIDEYKKEFDNLKSEKNKNILETLEKMNTIPIYQINDLVNVILNSIKIFKASQNDFKKSIDKLINLSDEHYTKLSEENRKYIDGKAKLFIDIMNNKITDIEAYNNLNNTNKEVDKKKDDENINYTNKNSVNNVNIKNKKDEYKGKYEELLKKQELLKQRIKVLEESLIAKEDLNKITTKNNEELTKKLQEVANNWMNSKATIEDLKRFINENVQQHDKIKKIYEQLHLDK